ncbi:MAG: hypothetical protein E7483_05700 [Ruminococcaceae bacterium]|nr:hypothetical protein [Oscillospiraceae bacterium]
MAFLDTINKVAKNIEEKTGDAIELAKHNAKMTREEYSYKDALKKIGEYYCNVYRQGGQVDEEILEAVQQAVAHYDAMIAEQKEINRINEENEAEKLAAKEAKAAEKAAAKEAKAAEKTEEIICE